MAAASIPLLSCWGGPPTAETVAEGETRYAGRAATLVAMDSIALRIAPGPALGSVDAVRSAGTSLIVMDAMVSRQICQYGPSGEFIRRIGSRGTGPGQYLIPFPRTLAIDGEGRLYVYDGGTEAISVYAADGAFVSKLEVSLGVSDALEFTKTGDLLQLAKEEDGIAYLRRYNKELELVYSVQLTDRRQSALVMHFAMLSGFCIDDKRQCLYYVAPGEYRVHQLDIESGTLGRIFGVVPSGFTPVASRYQGRTTLDPAEGDVVLKSTTLLHGGMHLLAGRYLVLGFAGPGEMRIHWLVYDTEDVSVVYRLDEQGANALENVRAFRAMNGMLYGLSQPADDELDHLNGWVRTFRLFVPVE